MDKKEILKRLMQQKLQLGAPMEQPKEFVPVTSRSPVPEQEIQVQDIQVNDAPIQQMGEIPVDMGQLSQSDHEEARKQALERLKQRGTQKLNFRGGILDQHGVYDNE